jgi:hypothetical protein
MPRNDPTYFRNALNDLTKQLSIFSNGENWEHMFFHPDNEYAFGILYPTRWKAQFEYDYYQAGILTLPLLSFKVILNEFEFYDFYTCEVGLHIPGEYEINKDNSTLLSFISEAVNKIVACSLYELGTLFTELKTRSMNNNEQLVFQETISCSIDKIVQHIIPVFEKVDLLF